MIKAKAPDKWKVLLKEAQKQHRAMLNKIQALQQEQLALRAKESVLVQISEGMLAILACVSSMNHPESSEPTCLQPGSDSAADTQTNSQGNTVAAAALGPSPARSTGLASGCSFGALEEDDSRVGCHLEQLESTIQSQLALIDSDGSMRAGQSFVSTKLLQLLFTPEQVDRVLSLSLDEIVLRLRHLAGRSAMMLLHDVDDPQLWDMAQLLDSLAASMAQGQGPAATGRSAHSSHSCSSRNASSGSASGWSGPSQLEAATGRSAGVCSAVPGRSAIAADPGPESLGDDVTLLSSRLGMHPAFEYILLVMTLMLWDEQRFHTISSMNLETMQPHCCMPPEHWQSVGRKLQLSADQLNTFALVKEVISTSFKALMARMRQTSEEQGKAVQQQQDDLCRMSQALQQPPPVQGPEVAPSHITLRQQQASQQESLMQQVLLLKHWRLLGLQQGICTLNTLSLRQMTAFCATSYPSISRIDLVLAAQAGSV